MDSDKLAKDPKSEGQKYIEELSKESVKPAGQMDILASNSSQPNRLDTLLRERKEHKDKLLKYILDLTSRSLLLLFLIVCGQIFMRTAGGQPHFSVFDGHELEVIITGVFGQAIGLILVIVRSLWDDKNYLEKLGR